MHTSTSLIPSSFAGHAARKAGGAWPLGEVAVKKCPWQAALTKPKMMKRRSFFNQLVAAYPQLQGGCVFEIELDISQLKGQALTDSAFASFVWVVKLTEGEANASGGIFKKDQVVHYQDYALHSYFQSQIANRAHIGKVNMRSHQAQLKTAASCGWYAEQTDRDVSAWHPVRKLKADTPLKFGHLTDVHVNVRQAAMQTSLVQLLPTEAGAGDLSVPYAHKKITNCYMALAELFESMKAGGADAILLTGDLIDFNKNLVPDQAGSTIASQWKAFNVLLNVENRSIYKRGMDDLLVFTLIRNAYVNQNMPVFMSTGNHEAYSMPYGISPRAEVNPRGWAAKLKDLEQESDAVALKKHRQQLEEASEFFVNKANAGIPADHNLTIYEATLIYGPTYAQVYTTQNHQSINYDWFSAAFCPLENYVMPLGADSDKADAKAIQAMTVLGWGQTERYMKGMTNAATVGADQRGVGFLPYAIQSISANQLTLLDTAKAIRKAGAASSLVASHFTIINYDLKHTLQEKGGFVARDAIETDYTTVRETSAQYNTFNYGAAELRVKTYLREHTNQAGGVDWHLSGHSHRAQVFKLSGTDTGKVRTIPSGGLHGFDPGAGAAGTLAAAGSGTTHFIVSSSGGPIGVQNWGGELAGWTLRPPSGSLLDTSASKVSQIKAASARATPRLCVALDYVVLSGRGMGVGIPDNEIGASAQSKSGKTFNPRLNLTIGGALKARTDCLDLSKIILWVFSSSEGRDENGKKVALKNFTAVPCTSDGKSLVVSDAQAVQAALGKDGTTQCAFLSIGLKKPDAAWAQDMSADDPWFFPVEVGLSMADSTWFSYIERPSSELGEVPNWKFWSESFSTIYPNPKKIINPNNEVKDE